MIINTFLEGGKEKNIAHEKKKLYIKGLMASEKLKDGRKNIFLS